MRRCAAATLLAIFLLASTAPTAAALPAVEVNNGMIFGGQSTKATNASVSTHNLSDLGAVVEVYTATWCDNCVYIEHALEELYQDGLLTPYHIHSTLSDPFGDEGLEQRFRDRYVHLTDYSHSPPGAVFNGTMKKAGSVPDSDVHDNKHDNRVEEFTGLAQRDLALGDGTTMFSWTPITNTSGTIAWTLDIDERHLENMTLNVAAWVVESAADYEEGSNGQGTYPHIVRSMVSLGNQTNGTATLNFPPRMTGTTWKSTSFTKSHPWWLKNPFNQSTRMMKPRTRRPFPCSQPSSWFVWRWRSAEEVAKTVLSAIEPIAIVFSVWPPVVGVVNLKLPTEVRNLCRWSDHVHVIPPSRWCAANPLSFLSISRRSVSCRRAFGRGWSLRMKMLSLPCSSSLT